MSNQYNPIRANRRKAFNTDVGSSVLTENAAEITDEMKAQAAQRLQDLIIRTQQDLNEDAL